MDRSDRTIATDVTREQLSIPISGGCIGATRYKPVGFDESLPAILMTTPYRKDDKITFGAYYPTLQYLALHGYEVVVSDLLGTGASSGLKEKPLGLEGAEVAEVIEWIAKQDWTDGAVGMFGKSYGGMTQLQAAAQQPDSLKTIVPIASPMPGYSCNYHNQAPTSLMIASWYTEMLALQTLPVPNHDVAGSWADRWGDRLDQTTQRTPWMFSSLEHPEKDAFWSDRDIDLSQIEVPTFAVCGFRDFTSAATIRYFEDIPAPTRLLLGPWRHTIPHRGRESRINFRPQLLEWYDHFLKREDNGALDRPKITYWTERDGGWKIDGGDWRTRDSWPRHSTGDNEIVSFRVGKCGLSTPESTLSEVAVSKTNDHTVGVHSMTQIINGKITNPDTNEDDRRSITFDTEPLSHPVEFTGTGSVELFVHSTVQSPIVAVRVNDVSSDGSSKPVTHTYLKADSGNPVAERVSTNESYNGNTGILYSLNVDLRPVSHVFERGHKIRLSISPAFFPYTFGTREQGVFTIVSTQSRQSLVTVPGTRHPVDGPDFQDTVRMDSPNTELVPTTSPFIKNSGSSVEVTREVNNGPVGYRSEAMSMLDLPENTELHSESKLTAESTSDDPASASIQCEYTKTLTHRGAVYEVVSKSTLTQDVVVISLWCLIDGDTIFEKRWRKLGWS